MPTPRFDAVIAALTESWFFPESVARSTAAAQGAAHAKTLRDEFNSRPDQAAIESSLGLGAYLVHTQANQRKIRLREARDGHSRAPPPCGDVMPRRARSSASSDSANWRRCSS